MSLKGKILFHGQTDTGLTRDHNEDTIGCNETIALAILADGMGGHRAGEMASAMTVSTILEAITEKTIKTTRSKSIDENTSPAHSAEALLLNKAITQANTTVYDSSNANAQYRGMGTTVVALMFYDNCFTVAHVGDSRLYRLRNNQLEQITRDHSLIQEQIEQGLYTPEQARAAANKNLITRAIGTNSCVRIDIQEGDVMLDDIYMLCSDGVNDMIEDDLIQSALIENSSDLEKATSDIIQLANDGGGKDNISVILAKPVKTFPAKADILTRLRSIFS